tara:strand:- start:456 stop:632 length:177 start_codon:yes stop_codon:yes gene_type:complete
MLVTNIILIVGFSALSALLFQMIPPNTEIRKLWQLFLFLLLVISAITLGINFLFNLWM